ncbi:MAG: hypothetical protein WBA05_02400 [Gordonia sp. (in: high G+C Gram-positive bacteria)]|uniref:hypothetical protein n=1 Tax=Gordonia sp. (in: high G+C Gram-positive bacteria) TaxID=84139 RepID=UPI003C73D651
MPEQAINPEATMQLIVTIDVNIATGRAQWLVQSDPPYFDGADSASDLEAAAHAATDWIKECNRKS